MNEQQKLRTELLRDQVMKTWGPPLESRDEDRADIAQTAVMVSLAFIMGRDFLLGLNANQSTAIEDGFKLMEETLF